MEAAAQRERRFLSTTVHPVDKKGRVSVPAHFRLVMAARGIDQPYGLRALDVPALNIGGSDFLDAYERRMADEDPFLGLADDMSYFIHGDGMFLKVDPEGRMTVTDAMREQTGIGGEVAFVGRGDFFQVWAPEKLKPYAEEVRARLLKARMDKAGGPR